MASRDYEEFIAALDAEGVRYLVVSPLRRKTRRSWTGTEPLGILLGPKADWSAELDGDGQEVMSAHLPAAPLRS